MVGSGSGAQVSGLIIKKKRLVLFVLMQERDKERNILRDELEMRNKIEIQF